MDSVTLCPATCCPSMLNTLRVKEKPDGLITRYDKGRTNAHSMPASNSCTFNWSANASVGRTVSAKEKSTNCSLTVLVTVRECAYSTDCTATDRESRSLPLTTHTQAY